jgi:hypothetical protein
MMGQNYEVVGRKEYSQYFYIISLEPGLPLCFEKEKNVTPRKWKSQFSSFSSIPKFIPQTVRYTMTRCSKQRVSVYVRMSIPLRQNLNTKLKKR